MYETEVNHKAVSPGEIPVDLLSAFGQTDSEILARSVLPWSEHCTECVWPTCYQSCDLYEPREDQRCRRFVDGMVRIDSPSSLNGYVLRIRFKKWAKLWTPGNVRLHSTQAARGLEKRDYKIATILHQLPLPASVKGTITRKRYSWKKRIASRIGSHEYQPDSFLLECYNPGEKIVPLSFTIRSSDQELRIPFQKLIELLPGFQRIRIPFAEISDVVDLACPFSVEMIPNESAHEATLYFGMMDFVQETHAAARGNIKCVVWDLDNTVWDGVLTEDGQEKLRLKDEVVDVIAQLDRRGILNSIASKNSPDEALRALKGFDLERYFLFPQISWGPKSEGIKAIATQLNIGMDAVLFVDDSDFELSEVAAACPESRLLKADQAQFILEMHELQPSATPESAARREMYQTEATRKSVAAHFGQDYVTFLRHCDIRLNIGSLNAGNLDRVHELTQRTNQMNFSGRRYSRGVLQELLNTPHLETFVLDCEDRFGSYGVIGFCIVDRREPRMTDLMFSCRVQSKRVEHAFIGFLIRKYAAETDRSFSADYCRTERNAPSGRVFSDLGMRQIGEVDGVSRLVVPEDHNVPDEAIIRITERECIGTLVSS